jgi:ABC-type antimicrobial peptide transport system permease subunit
LALVDILLDTTETQGGAHEAAQRLVDSARQIRDIESAAIVSALPIDLQADQVRIAPTAGTAETNARLVFATPDVFRTLGVRLLEGTGFGHDELVSRAPVVVISLKASTALFGNMAPLGRSVTLRRWNGEALHTSNVNSYVVVGVTSDTDAGRVGSRTQSVVYVPFPARSVATARLVARTSGDVTRVAAQLRRATEQAEPELPVIQAGSASLIAGGPAVTFRLFGQLIGYIGATALVLAMIGLYGVLSQVVVDRRRELAVRLALGAQRRNIIGLVLREGLRPVVVGLALGLALGLGIGIAGRIAIAPLFARTDAATYTVAAGAVGLSMLCCAVLACCLPARRAALRNPIEALRTL